ncbi:ABC transporter permease [Chryseosolibacter indicus]|uniref:ABC transporter permease n=1 Tax=Chryseosolibacter indicus TaxID=2782351 RepID=A0ABS5VTL5_9BACT|nr:ABC transporter permease [Chryseosolibacter indicus]MBT1704760.1 ABC transporter permease [Chryseosolibacter indicus]
MNKQKNSLLRAVMRLLEWFCPDYLYEEIEGDLIERYNKNVKVYGERVAKRKLVWNALRFFRPGIVLRNKWTLNLIPLYMLTNYFKIASRIMIRNKGYSMINIFGLAIGLTGAILLGLWITREVSYDQFHQDKHRIYNVWNKQIHKGGEAFCWSATPRVLAPTLQADFSAVESAISYASYNDSYLFSAGEKRIIKNIANFVDPDFLKIFTFPLLKGNVNKVLENPNSVVLTERFAKSLFGEKEAFGEIVTVSQGEFNIPFTVTGILKNLPSNTDFHFDFLLPFSFIESNYGKDVNWSNNSVTTWVKLKEGASLEALNAGIKDLKKRNTNNGENTQLFLYPLTRNHLYSRFENGVPAGGRIEIIRILGILGICLVTIACINFINLSTARASRRSKEVAVRKVNGAIRYSLVTQFLCESVLVAISAGVISLVAAYFILPFFNVLVQQDLTLNIKDISFWLGLFVIVVGVGIIAGCYPAFYLSSFRPARILKGAFAAGNGKNRLRGLLVTFQFGFALTLIVSTIVVFQQTIFLQNRDSGYEKNNLVYQYITGDLIKNFEAYKNELISTGAAISVTRTSSPITERLSNTSGMKWKGKDPEDKTVIERFYIDEGISTTAGVEIILGRDMDIAKYPSDSTAILLNEAAVKAMGFKDPLGEIVEDSGIEWHVVGVVKDFVLTSPHRAVEPIVMQGCKFGPNMLNVLHIRLSENLGVKDNLKTIADLHLKYNQNYPFEYYFVDTEYERKFANIESTLTITSLFTGIAILIGCLGLLGLATYMVEARIKEIGIRKVMGSSVFNIIKLLSTSSLKPIVWAIILFSPGAWLAMKWWLQSYQYRISFSIWVLVAAASSILAIAMITITLQVYRAARINPVNSLRSE